MRKGQFYMLDAFFAAAILFLGITILVSDFVAQPDVVQAQSTIVDVTEILYSEPIGTLSGDYIYNNYDIIDETLTPAQQVHAWVSNESCGWCQKNATALLESLVLAPVPPQHGVAIFVNGTEVVNRTLGHSPSFRIVDTRLTFTPLSITRVIGPDPIEVMVWA